MIYLFYYFVLVLIMMIFLLSSIRYKIPSSDICVGDFIFVFIISIIPVLNIMYIACEFWECTEILIDKYEKIFSKVLAKVVIKGKDL